MADTTSSKHNGIEVAHLVEKIHTGDLKAEAELVRVFSRGLMLMLIQRTNDPELAADLHQEAFIVVLNRLRSDGIEHPDQIKSFIWATAVNLFINEYRKQQRRNTWTDCDRFDYLEDAGADVVSQLAKEEASARVRRLIRGLPMERDREVLFRYYISGHEKSRICSDLELDSHHFDRVVYRAKQRLKQLLEFKME